MHIAECYTVFFFLGGGEGIEEGFIQIARQTAVVAFWGENGRPFRLCSRRIDRGRPGQLYSIKCLVSIVVLHISGILS